MPKGYIKSSNQLDYDLNLFFFFVLENEKKGSFVFITQIK